MSIDSLGFVKDTLTNPDGFIIDASVYAPFQGTLLALRQKQGFVIFQLYDITYDHLTLERIDFDGRGQKELIIKYKSYDQRFDRSGNGGFTECSQGFSIWDLDHIQQIASFDNYYCNVTYSWTYDDSKPDSLGLEERTLTDSSKTIECENFIPVISRKKITFTESDKCNLCGEEISIAIARPKTIKYILVNDKLIRLK